MLHGIAHGFHIGFNHGTQQCKYTQSNMSSAIQNPGPVDEYIDTELKAGWIVGPFKPEEIPAAQVSRFGVIPKRDQPGRWHLILDLSSSQNRRQELCSLKYASMDDAVGIIQEMGAGTLLAKVDLEHAYRNIPIHQDDRLLLAMRWRGKLYLDTVLPFGLRSAPKILPSLQKRICYFDNCISHQNCNR